MYLTGWYFRLRFWGPSSPETPRELAPQLNRSNRPKNIVALVNNNEGKLSSENHFLGIKKLFESLFQRSVTREGASRKYNRIPILS